MMMPNDPLSPGSMIGILGGGQLGRMLAMAAARLGLRCYVYSDDPKAPALDVAAAKILAQFNDRAALSEFARAVDVATVEFENVPASALAAVAAEVPVHPTPDTLAISQDRLAEKQFMDNHTIPVAPYRPVETLEDLREAIAEIGYPALLKTRRLGYDGKGQFRIDRKRDLDTAGRQLENAPGLVEALINFNRELSVVLVRDRSGAMRSYDASENTHETQILTRAVVPARTAKATLESARNIAEEIARQFNLVGVLCVEFFECSTDERTRLLVNEIAPRVHNSGHWTLDACTVSQFENHIRAIAGWPLGSTARHSNAEMINLLGDDAAGWLERAKDENAALHLYGKEKVRGGRKMGHITRLSPMDGENQ